MRRLTARDRLRPLDRAGAANLHGLARAMDGYWGTTLDVWPGLRIPSRFEQHWLGGLQLSGRAAPPPRYLPLKLLFTMRLGR